MFVSDRLFVDDVKLENQEAILLVLNPSITCGAAGQVNRFWAWLASHSGAFGQISGLLLSGWNGKVLGEREFLVFWIGCTYGFLVWGVDIQERSRNPSIYLDIALSAPSNPHSLLPTMLVSHASSASTNISPDIVCSASLRLAHVLAKTVPKLGVEASMFQRREVPGWDMKSRKTHDGWRSKESIEG